MVLSLSKPEAKVEEEETSHDPILQRLAKTDTFDSDWPILRHHMHLALLSTLPIFQARPPPAPYQFPPDTPPRPVNPASATPTTTPPKALTSAFASASTVPPSSSLLLSRSPSTSTSPISAGEDQPSTVGGLVIPPFPPLDPERRNNRRLSAGSIGPVPPAVVARMNGHQGGQAAALARGNVYEDEWDEAVVIGGKKMPGWMEEEEGKKEVERVGKLIDELQEPPFTIQRLAELLLNPTKHHSTLGKFLRALEKNLLVTTPWTAPSYVAVPPSTFSGSRGLFGPTSSPSTTASSPDSSSTMPVGSTTPMFSPIPFLVRPPMDADSSMDIDTDTDEPSGSASTRTKGEELMSPLVLDNAELAAEEAREKSLGEASSSTASGSASLSPSKGRSQTPEPEEVSARPTQPSSEPTPTSDSLPTPEPQPDSTLTSSESSDPAHQPYLGRVDELDTGPIIPQPISDSGSNSSGSSGASGGGGQEEGSGMGTGEGGNMTPHGMSEKPVPISATTTVGDEGERKVAGLPRTKSVLGLAERFVSEREKMEVGEKGEDGDDEEGKEVKKAKVEPEVKGEEKVEEETKEKEESMDMDIEVESKGEAEVKGEGSKSGESEGVESK